MKGKQRMRKVTATVAVTAIGVLVAGCGGSNPSGSSSSTTTTPSRPPIAQAALGGLLLTPAEIDSALGITGTKSKEKSDKLDDNSKQQFPNGWKFPDECVFAMGPAETVAYAGSGNTAVSTDDDVASATPPPGANPPATNEPDPEVGQAVVLFPSPKEANAFLTTSTQRWPACANRQITVPAGPDTPEMTVQVGPVANANSVLTTTVTVTATDKGTTLISISYQRALTVRDNVAIDVAVTRKTPPELAANLAGQIGAKVDKQ
jgi:hypothetical protein